MPGNRKLQRNGSAPDKVEEVMRRIKVEESDDNGRVGDDPGAYPDRPGEPDCIYYLRTGSCGYGSSCRFNHPSNAGQYYLKTGTCKYGSTCKYHHPKDRQADVLMNLVGLPMRQNTRSCPYYMRTGLCKYGYACKFHHPQPATTTNVLPVIGPLYGSGGSTGAPSSGASSVGDLSATPLSKATYFSNSLLQLPQNYMPLFLSPSQGWNTYMGSVAPLSVTSVLTAPASNGQLSASYLPERPDQPECRYFVIHGSCKYGLDCKYHHPREKISQVASSSLGPFGLPLRPGQAICSYYSLYGLCKYGPTCKFDHPLDGYSYAYSLAVPPLAAAAYSSTNPYQRTAPSRVSDWIKKGETAGNKNQQPNTKNVADSLPHSSKSSSEVVQNEAD
ncbi:UNVERIFIED_CONTAM: Zinc finger CCCH domain-containing protein 26 [Sesamum latifolium]|uniref:Zinc finger CCCH domain-containing protein 26 n=1 Tax=Sesamum latifolium TaxID=2727402 RepID=A0AAW2TNT0_9LAMI